MGSGCCWLVVGNNSVVKSTPLSAVTPLSLAELVPSELWDAQYLDRVMTYLNKSIPFVMKRKYLMLEWCKYTGVEFTREMAEALGVYDV